MVSETFHFQKCSKIKFKGGRLKEKKRENLIKSQEKQKHNRKKKTFNRRFYEKQTTKMEREIERDNFRGEWNRIERKKVTQTKNENKKLGKKYKHGRK
jgi:FlaA1/EpsC-like NDP-sugar epimerase